MTTTERTARTERWQRHLADLETLATNAAPLECQGKLVRVAGLVLEATGIKVPLGSVCRIQMPSSGNNPRRGSPPVNAEVVGFSGDRAYLMPTDEVQGLSSGATVVPRHLPPLAPKLGQPLHPWRRGEDRGLHLPMGDGLLVESSTPTATHLTVAASSPTSTTNPWCGAPSTRWIATPCARRWTPAYAPSTRC